MENSRFFFVTFSLGNPKISAYFSRAYSLDNEDAMEVLLSPKDMETSEEQLERRDEYLALLYME